MNQYQSTEMQFLNQKMEEQDQQIREMEEAVRELSALVDRLQRTSAAVNFDAAFINEVNNALQNHQQWLNKFTTSNRDINETLTNHRQCIDNLSRMLNKAYNAANEAYSVAGTV